MNETLAANSNFALDFAMAVFTVAMVSYAVDLAGFAPRAAEAEEGPPGAGDSRRAWHVQRGGTADTVDVPTGRRSSATGDGPLGAAPRPASRWR